MKEFNVTAVIWQEDEVYVSKCPELEVASAGDTPQEALENLKEAVELYIENAKTLGILEHFITDPMLKTWLSAAYPLQMELSFIKDGKRLDAFDRKIEEMITTYRGELG